MVYLHGSDERQQAIADELTKQAVVLLGRSKAKPSGTAAPDGIMTMCSILGRISADLASWMCAPTATRTRDLLLRRHFRSVPGWCHMWPDVPFRHYENGWR